MALSYDIYPTLAQRKRTRHTGFIAIHTDLAKAG